ncbi:MAG: hypothetical protein SFU83_01325 [Meiothermus sp.]|nr:hypothetical protein [Meiothermus sp.]
MNTASKVYVLRVWFEPSPQGERWRASVSQGEERRYFAEPKDLTAFLTAQFDQQETTTSGEGLK